MMAGGRVYNHACGLADYDYVHIFVEYRHRNRFRLGFESRGLRLALNQDAGACL